MRLDPVRADQESSNPSLREKGKATDRFLMSRLLFRDSQGKSVTTRLPGSLGPGGIGLIGIVLIKDDTFGRQPIQIRRLNPLVAVTADRAEVQSACDNHESI